MVSVYDNHLLAMELMFLLVFASLFRKFLKILKLGMLFIPSLLLFIVFATMFFRQILVLWMPELAMQLGFVIYLPAISPFSTVFLFDEKDIFYYDRGVIGKKLNKVKEYGDLREKIEYFHKILNKSV